MIYLYIELVLFALLLVCAPGNLYADYAAIMNFKRVRDTVGLSRIQTICGSYILLRGYLLDLLVNTIHMTILLCEFPKELTVTARLRRHIEGNTKHAPRCLQIRYELDALDPAGIHR